MKNLAALSLVFLFAFSSEAQIKKTYERVKQAVTGSAKISQPHYFPAQWEFLFSLSADITNIDINTKSVGLTVSKYKNSQQNLAANFTLGLTNSLFVGLESGYTLKNEYSYSLPTAPSENSTGMTDPILRVVFRAGDFDSTKLDLKLSFQPKIGDSKLGDSTHEGNGLYGANVTSLGGKVVFLATQASQLFLSGEYKLIGKRNLLDQAANEVTEIDVHSGTEFQVGVLTEIDKDAFFGLNFTISHEDSADSTNLSTNQKSESQSIDLKTLHLVGKREFTPDTSLEVQLGHILEGKSEGDGFDSDVEANSFGLSYLVRF